MVGIKTPQECESIDEVRAAIDAIDAELIAALGLRFQYVQAVMRFKSTEAHVRRAGPLRRCAGAASRLGRRRRAGPCGH